MSGRRPPGYWEDWENVEREFQIVIDQLGHFPKFAELQRIEKSSLGIAARYHGGLASIQERMGYDPSRKPQNYWKVWENIERELGELTNQLGHFPSPAEINRLRYFSLDASIRKYHGGIDAVRERMGYSPSRDEQSEQLTSLLEQYASGSEK
jgi:hypothetical protein